MLKNFFQEIKNKILHQKYCSGRKDQKRPSNRDFPNFTDIFFEKSRLKNMKFEEKNFWRFNDRTQAYKKNY